LLPVCLPPPLQSAQEAQETELGKEVELGAEGEDKETEEEEVVVVVVHAEMQEAEEDADEDDHQGYDGDDGWVDGGSQGEREQDVHAVTHVVTHGVPHAVTHAHFGALHAQDEGEDKNEDAEEVAHRWMGMLLSSDSGEEAGDAGGRPSPTLLPTDPAFGREGPAAGAAHTRQDCCSLVTQTRLCVLQGSLAPARDLADARLTRSNSPLLTPSNSPRHLARCAGSKDQARAAGEADQGGSGQATQGDGAGAIAAGRHSKAQQLPGLLPQEPDASFSPFRIPRLRAMDADETQHGSWSSSDASSEEGSRRLAAQREGALHLGTRRPGSNLHNYVSAKEGEESQAIPIVFSQRSSAQSSPHTPGTLRASAGMRAHKVRAAVGRPCERGRV